MVALIVFCAPIKEFISAVANAKILFAVAARSQAPFWCPSSLLPQPRSKCAEQCRRFSPASKDKTGDVAAAVNTKFAIDSCKMFWITIWNVDLMAISSSIHSSVNSCFYSKHSVVISCSNSIHSRAFPSPPQSIVRSFAPGPQSIRGSFLSPQSVGGSFPSPP